MNFQDAHKDSVQSLLARLRAAQDDVGSGSEAGAGPSDPPPRPSADHEMESPPAITVTKASTSNHTFSRQLGDLLSSYGSGGGSTSSQSQSTSEQRSNPAPARSAFTGSSRNLIEPFGPISTSQAKQPTLKANPKPNPSPDPWAVNSSTQTPTVVPVPVANAASPAQKADDETAEMSFTRALPVISALLEDGAFRQVVKRMKVDQDSLERRLWAKSENVKAEFEKTTRTDKEVARITGKEISPTKKQEWAKQLEVNLQAFYRQNCLPALDGLASRHREKLQQLGVPGLRGDMGDTKTRQRVRKIMDVIEGGLDE